ncbi:hypothetical protein Bbelb_183710 [Branchiostoma belcheri]|nr:hypothetical protein Bbelb_183710 [Branchiostoma belcheri]
MTRHRNAQVQVAENWHYLLAVRLCTDDTLLAVGRKLATVRAQRRSDRAKRLAWERLTVTVCPIIDGGCRWFGHFLREGPMDIGLCDDLRLIITRHTDLSRTEAGPAATAVTVVMSASVAHINSLPAAAAPRACEAGVLRRRAVIPAIQIQMQSNGPRPAHFVSNSLLTYDVTDQQLAFVKRHTPKLLYYLRRWDVRNSNRRLLSSPHQTGMRVTWVSRMQNDTPG